MYQANKGTKMNTSVFKIFLTILTTVTTLLCGLKAYEDGGLLWLAGLYFCGWFQAVIICSLARDETPKDKFHII
jgi:hypothetical protein